MRVANGVRTIALFEATKGLLVLLAGFGLLSLVHRDLQDVAEHLVTHLHLDPSSKYPRIFIDTVTILTDRQLWLLSGMALLYSAIRLAEGYGLWLGKRWAEWLAVVSGGIYLPIEMYEIYYHVTPVKILVFALNLIVVLYMSYVLWKSEGLRAAKK